jgi:hypothetical protein
MEKDMATITTSPDADHGYMHVHIKDRPLSNDVWWNLNVDETDNRLVGMELLGYEKFIQGLKELIKTNPSKQQIIEYMLDDEDYNIVMEDFSDVEDTREMLLEIAGHLVKNF